MEKNIYFLILLKKWLEIGINILNTCYFKQVKANKIALNGYNYVNLNILTKPIDLEIPFLNKNINVVCLNILDIN